MIIIRNLIIFIVFLFLVINFILDFSAITDQFGKNGKQFISKYLIAHKNTIILEEEIKDLTKERNKFERLKIMMEEVYTRIDQYNSQLKVFLSLLPSQTALARAGRIDIKNIEETERREADFFEIKNIRFNHWFTRNWNPNRTIIARDVRAHTEHELEEICFSVIPI